MKTYSSISASKSPDAVKNTIKALLTGLMLFVSVGIWYHYTVLDSIPLILILSTIFPPGIYSFIQILGYTKREIISLQSPSGKQGIITTLKTFFTHPIDLVIIPTYIATMLYMYMTIIEVGIYTAITVIVATIYIVQLLPLSIKREIHIRESKKALNHVRNEIKVTRIIFFDTSFTEQEKKYALRRHIAAEELMSVHSDFLIYSTGMVGTLILGTRLILPVFTGLGGQLLRPLLGG
jgi:hypothetical protein